MYFANKSELYLVNRRYSSNSRASVKLCKELELVVHRIKECGDNSYKINRLTSHLIKIKARLNYIWDKQIRDYEYIRASNYIRKVG